EAHNFDIRKNLLDFDDVNNDQRKVIYSQRNELLEAEDVKENIDGIREDVISATIARFVPLNTMHEQWDLPGLEALMAADFNMQIDVQGFVGGREEIDEEAVTEYVEGEIARQVAEREAQLGSETMRMLEKHFMLNVLDQSWKEHLAQMDYLRQGIHLRG